jgi:hypothetical protein
MEFVERKKGRVREGGRNIRGSHAVPQMGLAINDLAALDHDKSMVAM